MNKSVVRYIFSKSVSYDSKAMIKNWVLKRTYFWTYGSAFCVICCSVIYQTNLYARNESPITHLYYRMNLTVWSYRMSYSGKMSWPSGLLICDSMQIFQVGHALVETVGLDIRECVDFQCNSLRDNEPPRKTFIFHRFHFCICYESYYLWSIL